MSSLKEEVEDLLQKLENQTFGQRCSLNEGEQRLVAENGQHLKPDTQLNPFYGKDLFLLQRNSQQQQSQLLEIAPPQEPTLDNRISPQSFSDISVNPISTAPAGVNDFLFVLERSPCLKCRDETGGLNQQTLTDEQILFRELVKCSCANANNYNVYQGSSSKKDSRIEELFQRKRNLFRSSLERAADRKWTFLNSKPHQVIINKRFKSNLRTILREPVLKLNRRFKIKSSGSQTSFTTMVTVNDFRTTRCGERMRKRRSSSESSSVFELKELDQINSQIEAQASSSGVTPSFSNSNLQQLGCSQQARINCDENLNIDELASYFETFVHIPKKMSTMAEMMYT